ncbi:AsmA-like C-terminal region-containing protein, partial [Bradyrhizobium sp. NBAIM08]|uniref:AsmA-like C-terminal region-containing protein n=1 Tax=Bradyrhizobium sp. NBAIM08 TaxID=2793815 RepID=UPI001CD7AD22
LYGGTLTATIAARMVDGELVANANAAIADVPAGVALADAFGIGALDGRATATIALGSRGGSWGAFARAIRGTANVAIANGTFTGFEIPELAAVLSDPRAGPLQPDGDSTAFQRLSGTLAITEGDLAT